MFSFNFLIIVKGLTATSVQNAKFSSFYEFLWKMAAPSMYGKVILAFRNCFGGWKDFLLGMGIEPMTQMPLRLYTVIRTLRCFKWVPF